jgi:4-carboxymuconolactone decarboxylase
MDGKDVVRLPNLALLAPKLDELSRDVLFGDIWERAGLSKRDRSLITVAALVAMYRPEQLPFHLERAIENGLTRNELTEAFTHLAFYAGWPAAVSGLNAFQQLHPESIEAVAPDRST